MDASQALIATPENFQTEIIERSQAAPVVLLFWADQVPPSVAAKQALEGLVAQTGGKAVLALSDVSQDQMLAQHLRVQGLPAVRIISQGKIVEQLDGPLDEASIGRLTELLDTLSQSPADMLRSQLAQLVAMGQFDQALAMLQQAIEAEPNNQAFRVELADVLVLKGDLEDARTVLAGVPADTPERERPQNRLEFQEEAAGLDTLEALQAALADNADDAELNYQLSVRLAAQGDLEGGLEAAMTVLRTDREFRDDIGRLTMIRIFSLLPKGDDLATKYRRKMFNYMH